MEDCPCREGGVLRFADTDIEAAVLIAEAPLYLDILLHLGISLCLAVPRRAVGRIAQKAPIGSV